MSKTVNNIAPLCFSTSVSSHSSNKIKNNNYLCVHMVIKIIGMVSQIVLKILRSKKKNIFYTSFGFKQIFLAFMCIPQIAHFSDIYWEHYGTGRKVPPTGESTLKAIMFPATRPLVRRSYLAFEVYTMCSKKCNLA